MEQITNWVFIPLMIALVVVSFNEKLLRRVRGLAAVDKMETLLGRLDRFYWLFFVLILACGVFSRCWRFGELPLGVNQDGMMAGVEGYCLLHNGTDQYGISYPTYFQAWKFSQMSTLYSYLLMPVFKLLGMSKFTLRLPMLVISLVMMIVLWDLARRILGKKYALIVLFIVALNPWHMLQSRWALEANLMPHVVLLGVYLLYLGRDRRWALYLSMVLFGLAPYAYGLACFSMVFFLIPAAIYYFSKKKANGWDILVCVLIFSAVSGPYFYTMAINAFGWETAHIGPFTMPYFEDSLRSTDLVFGRFNPYWTMVLNLFDHLKMYSFKTVEMNYNAMSWTHAMYLFMPVCMLWGLFRMWQDRRAQARLEKPDSRFLDGSMLILLWFLAAVFNGIMIGGVVNRNNIVFYPLILLAGYTLYQMGRRLRSALALSVVMIAVSFAGVNYTYFCDEDYQKDVGFTFHDGLHQALLDTWDWDYDHYYLDSIDNRAEIIFTKASAMFAHQIDYSARNEEVELNGPDGEPSGWYFGDRYKVVDFTELELNPMDCAVYIGKIGNIGLMNPDEYLITPYENYFVAYPKYWAE